MLGYLIELASKSNNLVSLCDKTCYVELDILPGPASSILKESAYGTSHPGLITDAVSFELVAIKTGNLDSLNY